MGEKPHIFSVFLIKLITLQSIKVKGSKSFPMTFDPILSPQPQESDAYSSFKGKTDDQVTYIKNNVTT